MLTRPTALFVFLGLLWLQLFAALAPTWGGGTYYDYGWLVAPFAVLFFWRRWSECDLSGCRPPSRPGLLWITVAAALVLLIPVRVVQEVDVYWRLPLWVHGLVVFLVTHLLVALHLGWSVSRGLLPATIFGLLSLPMPSFLEARLVQGLTTQVVNLSSGALPYLGYPLEVVGTSMVVKGQSLDVVEGCSGIRSFQSSAMAALCLGELLRLAVCKRVILVLLGLSLAFLGNTVRIVVLARIAHDHGREAYGSAHDAVGWWVLVLSYGGLSLAAWGLGNSPRKGRTKVIRMGEAHE